MVDIRKTSNCVSHKKLISIINYNPITGDLTWRASRGGTAVKGSIAGNITPHGYRIICVDYKPYKAHRLAWFIVHKKWPNQIDHANHIRDDNRLCNLRNTSFHGNSVNLTKAKNNKSGVTGVSWSEERGKWVSQIQAHGKNVGLGRHPDKFEAICARMSANNKYGFHENHGQPKT